MPAASPPQVPRCDFCFAPNLSWSYPARDIDLPSPPGTPRHVSVGNWSACERCHDFIELDDRATLIRVVTNAFVKRHPIANRSEVWKMVSNVIDTFWAAQSGAPYRIDAEGLESS